MKKTPEDIMREFANEHSYDHWWELMYDSHSHTIIEYTKEVMQLYHKQFEVKSEHPYGVAGEISDILDQYDVSCPLERKDVTKIINDKFTKV